MFRQVNVPVLGIIENMSYFVCPHWAAVHEIFRHGGARGAAEKEGGDCLAESPPARSTREERDGGRAAAGGVAPHGPQAAAYLQVAETVI